MSSFKAPDELPKQQRLELALNAYNQVFLAWQMNPQGNKPAMQPIALSYGVVSSTLSRRIAGKTSSRRKAHELEQRLSPEEEGALESWILKVTEWGWPPRVSLVRHMACELLVEKGDYRELGKNWIASFLDRHKELQSRWSQPLDKERNATHDSEKLQRWFQLVESITQK